MWPVRPPIASSIHQRRHRPALQLPAGCHRLWRGTLPEPLGPTAGRVRQPAGADGLAACGAWSCIWPQPPMSSRNGNGCIAIGSNSSNVPAIKPTGLLGTITPWSPRIDWWAANWSGVGKRRCGSSVVSKRSTIGLLVTSPQPCRLPSANRFVRWRRPFRPYGKLRRPHRPTGNAWCAS